MSGIDSDLIRGHIDTIILKTLFDGDKYGYEILDEVAKKSNGAYELKQPTLYSCLKRLENQGLISSYWVDSEIGGKRHYYCLTEQGKETYIENQKNWIKSRQIIDNLIWENAPVSNSQEVTVEKQEETVNSNEITPEPILDYVPPIALDNQEQLINNDEVTDNSQIEEGSTLLDLINDNNAEDVNDETTESIMESTETTDEVDIMSLLGHMPQENNNEIEKHIDELNEVSSNLNEINEDYASNSFLENFVKNYMSSTEIQPESELKNETVEVNNEEFIDDFNLDLTQHLNANDSYFSSTDTKDKIDFITPNVIIDNLKPVEEELSHIEFIEDSDNEIYSFEDNKEETIEESVTPTYVSFGEEIVRNHEDDTAYSHVQDEYNIEENNSNDLDSLYESPNEEYQHTYENIYTNESVDNIETINYTYNEPNINNTISKDTPNRETNEYKPVYESQAKGFEVIPSKYTDDESKRKITELTSFAKESSISEEQVLIEENLFDTSDFLERNKATKNYDKLIADFEREGLSVRVHSKLVKESKDSRSYVETNKIKMTRNWISFCFISTLLAIVFAIMQSNDVTYYSFSYKYFIIGILVAMIVPIVSTIIFAINPYKKNSATFSASASFMLSALVFIQLLLIIYCINLQIGFYSFSQEYYNHLYWIIPSIISIYPILNSIVYTTLYKSKNFHS